MKGTRVHAFNHIQCSHVLLVCCTVRAWVCVCGNVLHICQQKRVGKEQHLPRNGINSDVIAVKFGMYFCVRVCIIIIKLQSG